MLRLGQKARKRIKLVLFIILVLVSITGIAFISRSPVLLVTDNSFNMLYGPARSRETRIKVSLELFRRVIPVSIAEAASEDLITIAVEEASVTPLAVIFPYRYLSGANYYRNKYPDVPVFIVGGQRPLHTGLMTFVNADRGQDMYLAGLCAAAFAGENKVLFLGDGSVHDHDWEAFTLGMMDQGHEETPVFISNSFDLPSNLDYGCVVVSGTAAKFLERSPKMPLILFSWIDPFMTPNAVKLVFDDSPWALLAGAIKNLEAAGEELLLPSNPILLAERADGTEEMRDFRNIRRIIKGNFKKNEKKPALNDNNGR